MRALTLGIVALTSVASSMALVGDAQAMCGCMVGRRPPPASPTEQGALLNKATVVVMLREGTHTVLSFQNDYFGPAEDFALVVPVPVVLGEDDVTTLDRSLFDRVQAVAAPHMVELYEQDPCPRPRPMNRGFGGGMMADGLSGGTGSGAPQGEAAPPPVVVEAQFQEGEYDITILGASDSAALERWLADNGYRLPPNAERYLRPYVQADMKFFVARVDIGRLRQVAQARRAQLERSRTWMPGSLGQLIAGPSADRGSDPDLGRFLSPLRIHYESEEFSLPVRLGLLNSFGEQDLVVHILSPEGRYELANYRNSWVPTNVHVNGRAARNFGRFYDAFFGALSGRAPRRVWTEYAGPLTPVASSDDSMGLGLGLGPGTGCIGCSRPGLAQADLDALGEAVVHQGASRLEQYTLTRLHYRYGQRGLPNDLVFRPGRAMAGGIEDATRSRLGRTARRATRNEFRVRFIAQHHWAGAVQCASPQRGRWGGRPWGGGSYRDVEETPWPDARPVPLGAWIRDTLPGLGVTRSR